MPLRRDLRRCRSCSASIVWAVTEEGRRMPVDASPSVGGNLLLFRRVDGELGVHVVDPESDLVTYRPHFATCPDADAWRKR